MLLAYTTCVKVMERFTHYWMARHTRNILNSLETIEFWCNVSDMLPRCAMKRKRKVMDSSDNDDTKLDMQHSQWTCQWQSYRCSTGTWTWCVSSTLCSISQTYLFTVKGNHWAILYHWSHEPPKIPESTIQYPLCIIMRRYWQYINITTRGQRWTVRLKHHCLAARQSTHWRLC